MPAFQVCLWHFEHDPAAQVHLRYRSRVSEGSSALPPTFAFVADEVCCSKVRKSHTVIQGGQTLCLKQKEQFLQKVLLRLCPGYQVKDKRRGGQCYSHKPDSFSCGGYSTSPSSKDWRVWEKNAFAFSRSLETCR